ncbi:hypothetical protein [Nonomuraea sediminis]|uniref:hypothetical protein n=1 Tax=Nonomuraea sediminis TaxID=2835864 RepID=UPI001BDC7728|nr:hypothetical protein [Nonomuraea sediminis]
MTQQYLAGELSLLLGRLQAVTTGTTSEKDVADLRHEAETVPVWALPSIAARALMLTDALCWESLSRADAVAFSHQAKISADLFEFSVCAGLLEEL